jgi:hypothetical protein
MADAPAAASSHAASPAPSAPAATPAGATGSSSDAPSGAPRTEPTAEPGAEPSGAQSGEPSAEPTAEPGAEPSGAPIAALLDALVRAMNDPRPEHVAAAFAEHAAIDRYDADAGCLVERHRGRAEIERWLRRTPSKYKFSRVGPARPRAAAGDDDRDAAEPLARPAHHHDHGDHDHDDHDHDHDHGDGRDLEHDHAAPASSYRPGVAIWVSEYAISSDDFTNGGRWHLQHGDDGRITWMRHHPFALRA